MSDIAINSSPYNPYTGRETLRLICAKIWEQLQTHQDFAEAIVYQKFSYDFTLSVTLNEVIQTKVSGKDRIDVRPRTENHEISGVSNPAPDVMRREAGLPVPTPTNTSGGIVDYPMGTQR